MQAIRGVPHKIYLEGGSVADTPRVRHMYFIIYLLSNRLCEGHVYKLFYYLVLHSRPILLDMNTLAHTIQNGFL